MSSRIWRRGQMIGGDHENNGLYLLDPTKKEPKVLQSPISEEDEVWLWHQDTVLGVFRF